MGGRKIFLSEVAAVVGSAKGPRHRQGRNMDEAATKAQVLNFLRRASGRSRATVTAEFTLGKSGVRADLALLADHELIGIEIKTARDNLRRLPAQLAAYAQYFDRSVLVVAECHWPKIDFSKLFGASVWLVKDCGIVPAHVGLHHGVASNRLLELLTAEEKRSLLASGKAVRDHTFDVFAKRYGVTSNEFWRSVSRRSIKSEDVKLLSRFSHRRDQERAIALANQERWTQWRLAYECNVESCLA